MPLTAGEGRGVKEQSGTTEATKAWHDTINLQFITMFMNAYSITGLHILK